MNKILLLLISTTIISCANNNDPLNKISFGQVSKEVLNRNMLENGFFFDSSEYGEFRYKIKDGPFSFLTEVELNSESSHYGYNQIRDLKLSLQGDTNYYTNTIKYFARSGGCVNYLKVDSLFETYSKWYGKPDSSWNDFGYNLFFDNKPKKLNNEYPRYDLWKTENYDIFFFRPKIEVKEWLEDSLRYSYADITYKMKNWDKRIKIIQDSVRKTLTPNDIISIELNTPSWSDFDEYSVHDTRIDFYLTSIGRKDREENKCVEKVKYKIILSDYFDEVLYTSEDLFYEFRKPACKQEGGLNKSISWMYGYGVKAFSYYSLSNKFQKLEKARREKSQNNLKVSTEISAVVFEDGSVLKNKTMKK